MISWKDTHPLTRCVSFLYGTNIDLFAFPLRILTFDTGNEATVLHLGEKPDNCGYFRNGVAAFICTATTMIIVFG